MNKLIRAGLLVALTVFIGGCSTEIYNPHFWHENFIDAMHSAVGHKLEQMQPGWARAEDLLAIEKRPDGVLAYRYRFNQGCEYTYEVDSVTHIIKTVSWTGGSQYCVLVP